MIKRTTRGAVRTLLAATLLAGAGMAEAAGARYFSFINYAGEPTYAPNEFVVEVRDPALAERYSQILRNIEKQPHVAFIANVLPGRAPYNEAWAFHVDPASLKPPTDASFHECSLSAEDVEENLWAVGDQILPGRMWCPWTMRLSREVKR
ncbi:hypothetical protein L2Y94_18500 [Luteibacter aegosomatis]|uniref:BP74-related protein n=1 Tax=Luteibacter aegosomatis TaxID=2911537 RepID=UPI001FFB64D4|nr:hypothetical protein [Luteibacter aegosomatis]UPG85271.1 hypothetical protein L2Y94_18500 [Luteibacter aegosomatis]